MDASAEQDPTFRIITTLRSILFNTGDIQKSRPLITQWHETSKNLLIWHRRRLRAAAQAYKWTNVCEQLDEPDCMLALGRVIEDATTRYAQPEIGMIKDIRIRLLIDRSGSLQVESVPMGEAKPLRTLETDISHQPPSNGPPWSLSPNGRGSLISLDTVPTVPALHTLHKTTYRAPYDAARERAGIAKCPPGEREVLLFNPEQEIMEASLCAVYFYRNGKWVAPSCETGGWRDRLAEQCS
ncbi:hypothetical protein PV05_01710 [Exophiala xenobiotica]|uniref:Uncharacterized protein n=1 Tax=Exophiala xenobiotica TaxID=348802 RepID=A0A0D2FNJ3_9EURO|nr:uncharacterized protein PV05_01710 [Exophiala xenobiotica]KIW61609.1 hypothetical protein PV05_01710 [Exophiala xenobiotica]